MGETQIGAPASEPGEPDGSDLRRPLHQPTLPGLEAPAAAVAAGVPVRQRRRHLKIAAVVVSQVALAGAAGAGGYLAWANYDRAERWQERAATLEQNVDALNELLVDRSETLNARTRELDGMAAKVKEAQRALRRSESDVASLAKRQRELSNEKAQVEDARAVLAAQAASLEGVAAAFITCKGGLVDLLGYVARDDYDLANYYWDAVSSDCGYAEATLQDYLTSYG